MSEEEIGTTDRNGNFVLAPVCLVHESKKTKGITIAYTNVSNNENITVDMKGNNIMKSIVTTTERNKTFETTDNREIKINNITISSVGKSLPLSGVISIETTS